MQVTDFLGFPSADTVSEVASWYIRCIGVSFYFFVSGFGWKSGTNVSEMLVEWDAKDFSRSRTCATDYR